MKSWLDYSLKTTETLENSCFGCLELIKRATTAATYARTPNFEASSKVPAALKTTLIACYIMLIRFPVIFFLKLFVLLRHNINIYSWSIWILNFIFRSTELGVIFTLLTGCWSCWYSSSVHYSFMRSNSPKKWWLFSEWSCCPKPFSNWTWSDPHLCMVGI